MEEENYCKSWNLGIAEEHKNSQTSNVQLLKGLLQYFCLCWFNAGHYCGLMIEFADF